MLNGEVGFQDAGNETCAPSKAFKAGLAVNFTHSMNSESRHLYHLRH